MTKKKRPSKSLVVSRNIGGRKKRWSSKNLKDLKAT